MKLLKPGTGNQVANRKKAVKYIAEHVIETDSYDPDSGTIVAKDGRKYHISAYAETSAAFVTTPGVDKSKNSIYESGLVTLMYRQLENDPRSFIYEVDPLEIHVRPNSNSAEWRDVDKASTRIWICTEDKVILIERRAK